MSSLNLTKTELPNSVTLRPSKAKPIQNPKLNDPSPIFIVGAGVAGLSAARTLQQLGYASVILEARDRIGGRIWTDRSWGVPLDLGASWIHGREGNPLTKLSDELGLRIQPTSFDRAEFYDPNGRKFDRLERQELTNKFQELLYLQPEQCPPQDCPLEHAYFNQISNPNLTEIQKNWMRSAIASYMGADVTELSWTYWNDEEPFPGDDCLMVEGYDRIANKLAQGLDFRLNQIACRIEYGKDGVAIETQRDRFEAKCAIITLPLGVLQSGTVAFDPPLPQHKQDAIRRLGMGLLDKVALRFPHAFWSKDADFFAYLSNSNSDSPLILNLLPHLNAPVLLAFFGGESARIAEARSQRELVERIRHNLQTLFGSSIPEPTAVQMTRWSADPFACGSYSFIPVGASGNDYEILAEPIGERLFFAGEATNRKHPSTVHGAFLSGLRAAQEAIASFSSTA